MELKVDIIAKQRIKPSSPTPTHLKNFNLSLLDQIHPPIYGLIILFYSADTKIDIANVGDHHQCPPNSLERNNSQHLKNSLAETLTSFYPVAGKLKDAISVDCNDEGALFIEANVDCNLSEFLTKPDAKLLNHFLPTNDPTTRDFAPDCMGIIQFTRFQCGGTAISVCLSHKVFDVSSLITFLDGWTSNFRGCSQPASPVFIGDTLLPPRDLSSFMPRPNYMTPPGKLMTKRFVFEASKIAGLKAKVGPIQKRYPSRVEVVLALILKGAMSASRSITGSTKPSVLFQAVDLRRRMNPPLPKNSVGNLFWLAPVVIKEEDMDLKTMVYKMKEGVNEFSLNASRFNGEEGFTVISEFFKGRQDYKDMERYSCTSWCKFPLYETDFGFGKPVWVSSTSVAFKSTIVLVDTKQGDGIEAWVTLEEENMLIFECNYQKLLYSA